MVLEHILPEEWLEQKTRYAFFLGGAYSLLGILFARLLFPADPALPAVAFTSLLLLPEIYKIFSIEERQQRREKKLWNFKSFWKDNGDFYRVFLLLFLGILLAYSLAAMFLPSFSVNQLFREQIEVRGPGFQAAGMATGDAINRNASELFSSLFKNNIIVLLAVFIVALLAGDGAIFLIVWNASVWGTIFGLTARNAAFFSSGNPVWFFFLIAMIVLPHVLLEASGYILAAISGGLISKGALVEKFNSVRFNKVFKENVFILLLAVLAIIIGVAVEVYVLKNSETYIDIISLSLRFI